jgi:exosortase
MAEPSKLPWRSAWAWLLLGAVWLLVGRILSVHWVVNPVYSYGWLVPVFGLYVAWRRWATRPAPGASLRGAGWVIGLAALAFFPTWLFAQPSPDWSLTAWLLTGEAVALTLGVVAWVGGWRWLWHFAFPICFLFTAVPCPRVFEVPLTHRLMGVVAGVTVEILTVAGVAAVQHGNVIEVRSGLLGIEEACSGVRSMQAALMGALFLGELFRFGWRRRALLLGCGLLAALATNVARTFFLAWTAARDGLEAVNRWHDPAGLFILTVCLLLVWLVGWWLSRNDRPQPVARGIPAARALPASALAAFTLWFAGVVGATEWWFHEAGRPPESRWGLVPLPGSAPVEISPVAADQLRCDATTATSWKEDDGGQWTLFFLEWKPGPTASRVLAGTHRPEICLTAIGMKLVEDRGTIEVQPAGIPLHFRAYTFEQEGRPVHVYYGIWQVRAPRPSRHGAISESPHRASVQAVLWRERHLGQQVAELVASGYATAGEADAAFREAMDRLLIVRLPSYAVPGSAD